MWQEVLGSGRKIGHKKTGKSEQSEEGCPCCGASAEPERREEWRHADAHGKTESKGPRVSTHVTYSKSDSPSLSGMSRERVARDENTHWVDGVRQIALCLGHGNLLAFYSERNEGRGRRWPQKLHVLYQKDHSSWYALAEVWMRTD